MNYPPKCDLTARELLAEHLRNKQAWRVIFDPEPVPSSGPAEDHALSYALRHDDRQAADQELARAREEALEVREYPTLPKPIDVFDYFRSAG